MIPMADNKRMTSIIFISAVALLIVLAGIYGHDSRPHEHGRHHSNF